MTILEILTQARARIALPEHWTQTSYAKDKEGRSVASFSSEAVCWCAMGAVDFVLSHNNEPRYPMRDDVRATLIDAIDGHPASYNDSHTHAEVLAMFDKAIAAQRSTS